MSFRCHDNSGGVLRNATTQVSRTVLPSSTSVLLGAITMSGGPEVERERERERERGREGEREREGGKGGKEGSKGRENEQGKGESTLYT